MFISESPAGPFVEHPTRFEWSSERQWTYGVPYGTKRYFLMRGYSASGVVSPDSNIVEVQNPPPPPQLSIRNQYSAGAELQWTVPPGCYTLEMYGSDSPGGPYTALSPYFYYSSQPFWYYAVPTGSSRFFKMRAWGGGMFSAYSNPVEIAPKPWRIVWSGEVLQQNGVASIRASAGAIDDHDQSDLQYRAHTRKVTLQLLDGQATPQPVANALVELLFVGNTAHDDGSGSEKKTARLHRENEPFDAAHPWAEVLGVYTDAQGWATVWVKSGDLVCQPKLQVNHVLYGSVKNKVGEINCDFAAAESLRRFVPLKADGTLVMPDEGEDSGWIFDFPNLVDPENQEKITPAKLYRKFKRDPQKGDDAILADGRGNWNYVNGHTIHTYIAGVKLYGNEEDETFYDGPEVLDTPANLRQYAFIKDQRNSAENSAVNTVDRVTANDGATLQVYVKAGPDIGNVAIVWVDGKDLNQWEE